MVVVWFVLGAVVLLGALVVGVGIATRRANEGDGGPMIGVRLPGSHPFLTSSGDPSSDAEDRSGPSGTGA